MKRIYLLFAAFILCLMGQMSFAQSNGYNLVFFGPDSGSSILTCTNGNTLVFTSTQSTGYAVNETAIIDIDWGDGSAVENHPVTFVQQNYYNPYYFSHSFTTAGNFDAYFTFSDTHGNVSLDTVSFIVTNNCGSIYTSVTLDTDGNGSGDVYQPSARVDIKGSDSIVYTVPFNVIGQNLGIIQNVDVTKSPYIVSVNPAWLASNGYVASPLNPTYHSVSVTPAIPYNDTPSLVIACDPNNPSAQTDVSINYMYGWGFRAGLQTGYLRVDVCNLSCSGTQNADLDITFESLLSVYSQNIPGATVTGNVLHANLNVSGCSQYDIYFDVPGVTPAFTPLNFTASIQPVGNTDYDASNNIKTVVSEVRNSWDPNDKSVDKPEIISPAVQDELTYVIRFQNKGNDEAYNIVIKDTLSANLDLSTLTMLEYSHAGYMNVDPATRIMTVSFPNIFLAAESVDEPASHGYVSYKIKENAGLSVGSEIKNTAYIYFDANPAIITNTTFNVNQNMAVEELVADDIAAYPVPASDFLVISSKQNQPIQSVKLIDVTGKTILNITNVGATYTMDVQGIASGAYSLSIQSQGVVVNKKIMIQK